MVEVEGPFPSCNVGVQIANIAPVNKGEIVWTLDFTTLGRIGRVAKGEAPEFRTMVALTGPEVATPALVETTICAQVTNILAGHLNKDEHHRRIISGNVFTGIATGMDGFLHYPYRQLTVIAEGDDVDEFMGWASLAPSKMSESTSFPGHFLSRKFRPDARLNGGRRAMIMSGQYDKVMPMDILPEYLLKAIISKTSRIWNVSVSTKSHPKILQRQNMWIHRNSHYNKSYATASTIYAKNLNKDGITT